MTDFSIIECDEQPTAVRRDRVAMADIRDFFDTGFSTVASALADQGLVPDGPPFARYIGMPSETVDVEVGFPVTGFAATETVAAGTLPACRAVTGVHAGPYEDLHVTWRALHDWGVERDLAWADTFWESYLTDPRADPDPSHNRTQVVQPLLP